MKWENTFVFFIFAPRLFTTAGTKSYTTYVSRLGSSRLEQARSGNISTYMNIGGEGRGLTGVALWVLDFISILERILQQYRLMSDRYDYGVEEKRL
jgi:hypothetical protein